eukprot:Hpha_TRINITY_DN13499_c0_g1::TRINITY_DN13499_c0_g1_i1::g.130774::m.130774
MRKCNERSTEKYTDKPGHVPLVRFARGQLCPLPTSLPFASALGWNYSQAMLPAEGRELLRLAAEGARETFSSWKNPSTCQDSGAETAPPPRKLLPTRSRSAQPPTPPQPPAH